MEEKVYRKYFESPVGTLELTGSEKGLEEIKFGAYADKEENTSPLLEEAAEQLEEYFEGKRREFTVKLAPKGTEFQLKVWDELLRIPYGRTASYKEIAMFLGDAGAVRAVGNANSKNPVPVIIPCHRVVGSGGDLTGFAGGLWRKKWLLEHEQKKPLDKQFELFGDENEVS